jgi:YVTN family beta-propeller protein
VAGVVGAAAPAQAVGGPFGYVTDLTADTISVVDLSTNTVTATIPDVRPQDVAVSRDGAHAYVDDQAGISVIDTATNTVSATIPISNAEWNDITINPSGSIVYALDLNNEVVDVIDTATNTVTTTVSVTSPYGAAVNPAGTRLFVTDQDDSTVKVIDTATNTVIAAVPVGDFPMAVAVSPDGSTVYCANDDGTVSVIDTVTDTVTTAIPAGGGAEAIVLNPAGTAAYVADESDGTVKVIDTATDTVTTTIPAVGGDLVDLAISPTGSAVYATNGLFAPPSEVVVIDTATNTVSTTIGGFSYAFGIAIPAPAPAVTFPFTGFFQPVDNPPTINSTTAGQGIPVKFSLGGDRGLNILAAGSPSSQQATCGSGTVDPIETTTTSNSGLTYNSVSGQYTYVWKTDKAWKGTCRTFHLKLTDGTNHTANFQFK